MANNRGARPVAQAIVSEQIALKRLQKEGYTKIHRKGHAHGADFMAYKSGKWYLIEVKSGTSYNWKPRQLEKQAAARRKNAKFGYKIVRVDVSKPATQKKITKLTRSYAAKRRKS